MQVLPPWGPHKGWLKSPGRVVARRGSALWVQAVGDCDLEEPIAAHHSMVQRACMGWVLRPGSVVVDKENVWC
jgi:hypothetical protein